MYGYREGPPIVDGVNIGPDPAAEIRAFLKTRRDRLTPEAAGLTSWGTRRRVSGLRREEVAQLAGISVEYYTRLERGQVGGLSPAVTASVASALRLDDVETTHFIRLVRAVGDGRAWANRGPLPTTVPRSLLQLLEAITGAAAFIRNDKLDVLAANTLARTLYADLFERPDNHDNLARFVFLDPAARRFYLDWDAVASDAVGSLRALSAQRPADTEVTGLVRTLRAADDGFMERWSNHEVRAYRSGTQRFHHRSAGNLELDYDAVRAAGDTGLVLVAYSSPTGLTSALSTFSAETRPHQASR